MKEKQQKNSSPAWFKLSKLYGLSSDCKQISPENKKEHRHYWICDILWTKLS